MDLRLVAVLARQDPDEGPVQRGFQLDLRARQVGGDQGMHAVLVQPDANLAGRRVKQLVPMHLDVGVDFVLRNPERRRGPYRFELDDLGFAATGQRPEVGPGRRGGEEHGAEAQEQGRRRARPARRSQSSPSSMK